MFLARLTNMFHGLEDNQGMTLTVTNENKRSVRSVYRCLRARIAPVCSVSALPAAPAMTTNTFTTRLVTGRAAMNFFAVAFTMFGLTACDSGAQLDDSSGTSGNSIVTSTTDGNTTDTTTDDSGLTPAGVDNSTTPSSTPTGDVSLDAVNLAAARFLTQATFGATESDIASLRALGTDAWLERQFSLPVSRTYDYTRANSNGSNRDARHEIWWNNVLDGEDQLRQRVAYALSQIFVVSDVDQVLVNRQFGMAHYYDMLAENAFGNYRELLELVTLHPVMGVYLTHIRSEKADPLLNIRPDENYAREVLQLFSTGLNLLQLDGEPVLSGGRPVAVYTQTDIEEFARVYTGWNYASATTFDSTNIAVADFETPMVPVDEFHDFGEKRLLSGTVLPAGQSPRQDLEQALDNIFQHQNVGPFFSRLMIQRLVTSNPSPAYISRVASVFNNNGAGERGDLQALVRAILIDDEARSVSSANNTNFGKVREPVIRLAHVWRALDAVPGPESGGVHRHANLSLERLDELTGQAVMRSPSVFNFYQADTPISPSDTLVAPEIQITTEANVAAIHTNFHHQFYRFTTETELQGDNPRVTQVNLTRPAGLASNTRDLMDWIDLVFFSGGMPDYLKSNVESSIRTLSSNTSGRFSRAQEALFLTLSSPAFGVQR